MPRKQIVSHVRNKSREAESWENTAEFTAPLPEPEALPEKPVQEHPPAVPVPPAPDTPKSDTLYWLILVLILLIVLVALTGFLSVRNLYQNFTQTMEIPVPETTVPAVTAEPETTLPPTEKETILIEIPEEPPSDINAEISDFTDFSALLSDMYQQYFLLLEERSSDACKGGYLTDINQDGLDEMILFTDAEPSCYEIFTYQNKNAVSGGTFGSYSAYLYFSESTLYRMTGRDGSIYLHYQDNYEAQTIAGYYSARNRNTLSVLLEYGLSKNQNYRIKWHIFYEDAEYPLQELNAGSTLGSSLYEVPASCQKKAESFLEEYSFWISDASEQTKLEFLDFASLSSELQLLSGG